jgi:hypothetical protein
MIVKKIWMQSRIRGPEWMREGWYLCGFIPLYIRDVGPRRRVVTT